MDVIDYGEPVTTKGLNMLYGPGNDLVSATALTAAGAHMVLFSTGRGTPFGAPRADAENCHQQPAGPPEKRPGSTSTPVSSRTAGARWTRPVPTCTSRAGRASGKQTCAEKKGFREISIFKDGVVL